MWAHGATWDQMRLATTYDEGDVVRALRRTVDLCRQFTRAPNVPAEIHGTSHASRAIAIA